MHKRLRLAAVACAVAISLNAGDSERQLEAAIHREIVLGDLNGSIEQYRALMASGGPRVAAQAAYRMAQCQEKLGQRKEAYNTYRRIATEFGDQGAVASQALAKLAAWSGPKNLKFDEGVPGRVPPGWFVVPSLPKEADYVAELRRDVGCRSRAGCAVVQVPMNIPRPEGYLMQSFSAASYAGKTVRLRAWLRLESFFPAPMVGYRFPDPEDRAQLWINVERANRKHGFSGNMDDRPVRSREWTRAEIVGRIDDDAQFINFGVSSIGGGRVWVDDVTFEVIAGR